MRRIAMVVGLVVFSVALVGDSDAKPRVAVEAGSKRQHHVSMSMTSGDPVGALAKVERLVKNVGGEVEHANADTNNGNLSARIPPSKIDDVIAGLRRVSGRTDNVSRSSSDLTSTINEYSNRLADLALAEKALGVALKTASDDTRRGLMLLFELSERERKSIESTLESYEQQSVTASLNVSISLTQ